MSHSSPGLATATIPGPGLGAALLGHAALAALLTWPLSIHFGDRLPAGGNDLFQNIWNFWWWREALLELGVSPYSTTTIFHPDGASLAFHTHSEANIFLAFPIVALAGPVAALCFTTWLGFVLAGSGAWFLARDVVRDSRAAFVAGAIFAYFPQHIEQSLEHLNLASYGCMGFATAFVARGLWRCSRWDWVGACLAILANSLFSYHNTILLIPVLGVLFLWALWARPRPRLRIAVDTLLAATLGVALHVPFAWPMISDLIAGRGGYVKPAVDKPLDLLFFIVPAPFHTIWGELFVPLYERCRPYRSVGFVGYLGLSTIILALLGSRRRASEPASGARGAGPGPWIASAFVCLVLSLGDELRVAGHATGIPLPFRFLRSLPILDTSRLAHRFLVPGMLALSVLAGSGLATAARSHGISSRVAVAALAIVAIDFLAVPYPLRDVPRPRWVDVIDSAPPGAVLDIPGGYRARAAEDMYLQTLHGRPIIGGYVSVTPRTAAERLDEFPYLRVIFEGRPASTIPASEGLPPILERLDIGAVVLHASRIRERIEALAATERDPHRARIHNPEKGIPRTLFDAARRVLVERWGEPAYADGDVEIFFRPSPRNR
jgi:hypothetical protein